MKLERIPREKPEGPNRLGLFLDDTPSEQGVVIMDRNGRPMAVLVFSDFGDEANIDVTTVHSDDIKVAAYLDGVRSLNVVGIEHDSMISVSWEK